MRAKKKIKSFKFNYYVTLFFWTLVSVGTRGLRWEYILRIPMRVVKGVWNGVVSRNNRKKVGPVSVLGRARYRTLRNVYGLGARSLVQLLLQTNK